MDLINVSPPTSFEVILSGDFQIARSIWEYDPENFTFHFIKIKHKKLNINFNENTLDTAIHFMSNNKQFFNEFNPTDFHNSNDLFQHFKKSFLGFDDEQHRARIAAYRNNIENSIIKLKEALAAIDTQRVSASTPRNNGRLHYLDCIKSSIELDIDYLKESLDESLLAKRAALYLSYQRELHFRKSATISFEIQIHDLDLRIHSGFVHILPITFDNPVRHLIWISQEIDEQIEKMSSEGFSEFDIVQYIDNKINILDKFRSILDTDFLKLRRKTLLEVVTAANHHLYSAAYTHLACQLEGVLFDFAKEIDGMFFDGEKIDIDLNLKNQTCKCREGNKPKKYNSIESLLFTSNLLSVFPNIYLEYFSSNYYRERCSVAHGREIDPLTAHDLNILILYFISTIHAITDILDNSTPKPMMP